MELTGVDQHEFRAGQRRDWNAASKGWREWSEFIDRTTAPVSEKLMAMARVEPGQRVLDVAAGYGEPSLTAASIVGPEGAIVATDISPGVLEYGRERAAAAGLQNVEFIESRLRWTSRRAASTRRCRVGESSSSPMARARPAASADS